MNKTELVNTLSDRLHISTYHSRTFINVLMEVMEEALKDDQPILLQGFGTFECWKQSERPGRNPQTGKPCLIRARTSVKFKPGKLLLQALNSK